MGKVGGKFRNKNEKNLRLQCLWRTPLAVVGIMISFILDPMTCLLIFQHYRKSSAVGMHSSWLTGLYAQTPTLPHCNWAILSHMFKTHQMNWVEGLGQYWCSLQQSTSPEPIYLNAYLFLETAYWGLSVLKFGSFLSNRQMRRAKSGSLQPFISIKSHFKALTLATGVSDAPCSLV